MKITIAKPDLASGTSRVVASGGRLILLCRADGRVHAFASVCPHQLLSLEGARVRGGQVWCPHHGARFALNTGASTTPLTPTPLAVYACAETEEGLEIELPDLPEPPPSCVT